MMTKHKEKRARITLAHFCFLPITMLTALVISLIAIGLTACTVESYDTGDGDYSYYTAEMVMLSLKEQTVNQGTLDDDRVLNLNTPLQTSIIQKNFAQAVVGDICRLMLYFNKDSENNSTINAAKAIGAEPVLMPKIALADTLKAAIKTDPLTLVSSWKAKNGKYYNYKLSVKTGVDDVAKTQTLGLICDSIRQTTATTSAQISAQETIVYLQLSHDQKNVPQFYSADVFFSISKKNIDALLEHYGIKDKTNITVRLSLNTYQGKKLIEL